MVRIRNDSDVDIPYATRARFLTVRVRQASACLRRLPAREPATDLTIHKADAEGGGGGAAAAV